MAEGWVKLHRKILDWEWYDETNVCRLFFHLLLRANHKDKNYRGGLIKRGSLTTSIQVLSDETHLSVQQVRTALSKLKSTNEITIKTTNKYTCISINSYDTYQENNKQPNKRITNNQQTNNKQITTNKNVKNEKNVKKERGNHLPKDNEVSEEKMQEIADRNRVSLSFVKSKWEDVMNYCHSRDKRYKDFERVLASFVKKDAKGNQIQVAPTPAPIEKISPEEREKVRRKMEALRKKHPALVKSMG